jgi:hypothetical protein
VSFLLRTSSIDHIAISDFVPVGVLQKVGVPENLHLLLREIKVRSPLVVYDAGAGCASGKTGWVAQNLCEKPLRRSMSAFGGLPMCRKAIQALQIVFFTGETPVLLQLIARCSFLLSFAN